MIAETQKYFAKKLIQYCNAESITNSAYELEKAFGNKDFGILLSVA